MAGSHPQKSIKRKRSPPSTSDDTREPAKVPRTSGASQKLELIISKPASQISQRLGNEGPSSSPLSQITSLQLQDENQDSIAIPVRPQEYRASILERSVLSNRALKELSANAPNNGPTGYKGCSTKRWSGGPSVAQQEAVFQKLRGGRLTDSEEDLLGDMKRQYSESEWASFEASQRQRDRPARMQKELKNVKAPRALVRDVRLAQGLVERRPETIDEGISRYLKGSTDELIARTVFAHFAQGAADLYAKGPEFDLADLEKLIVLYDPSMKVGDRLCDIKVVKDRLKDLGKRGVYLIVLWRCCNNCQGNECAHASQKWSYGGSGRGEQGVFDRACEHAKFAFGWPNIKSDSQLLQTFLGKPHIGWRIYLLSEWAPIQRRPGFEGDFDEILFCEGLWQGRLATGNSEEKTEFLKMLQGLNNFCAFERTSSTRGGSVNGSSNTSFSGSFTGSVNNSANNSFSGK